MKDKDCKLIWICSTISVPSLVASLVDGQPIVSEESTVSSSLLCSLSSEVLCKLPLRVLILFSLPVWSRVSAQEVSLYFPLFINNMTLTTEFINSSHWHHSCPRL